MATLKEKEAFLTNDVAELLRQNGELLEAEKKSKIEMDNIIGELGLVQKVLENARLKLAEIESLLGKLEELIAKTTELEVKVGELKVKMVEAKKVGIIKFKESNNYKLELNITPAQFFAKESLKMKQLLQRHH